MFPLFHLACAADIINHKINLFEAFVELFLLLSDLDKSVLKIAHEDGKGAYFCLLELLQSL
jgi:hypothetical protein